MVSAAVRLSPAPSFRKRACRARGFHSLRHPRSLAPGFTLFAATHWSNEGVKAPDRGPGLVLGPGSVGGFSQPKRHLSRAAARLNRAADETDTQPGDVVLRRADSVVGR